MKPREILTKEFLQTHYIKLGKSAREIADEFHLKYTTVCNYITKFGFPNRKTKIQQIDDSNVLGDLYKQGFSIEEIANLTGMSYSFVYERLRNKAKRKLYETILTEDFLRKEYIDRDRTAKSIADEIGCSESTISLYAKKYDLRKCTSDEAYKPRKRLSPKHPHLAAHVYSKLVRGAKERDISVTICIDDIWERFVRQDRRCAISGVRISFPSTYTEAMSGAHKASVDRIDSSRGYSVDNIQIVHSHINMMKSNHSQSDFISWCKIIADYNS